MEIGNTQKTPEQLEGMKTRAPLRRKRKIAPNPAPQTSGARPLSFISDDPLDKLVSSIPQALIGFDA